MKKLRLEIEHLQVESFATAAGPENGRGTVRGLAEKTYFPQETCPMEYTPFVMSCDPADCRSMVECPSFHIECPMLSSECTADPNDTGCGG